MNQGQNEHLRPEKEKVNIYDNDEAYMLNDEKDLDMIDSGNREEGMDHYGYEDDDAEREMVNSGEEKMEDVLDVMSEEGTVRKERDQDQINDSNNSQDMQDMHDMMHPNSNGDRVLNANSDKERSKSISNLITLKYISVCQCCKENFNSNSNVPFLLKCGHFFCRSCLISNFTEDDGRIFCPDDGLVANSISDLKLLNNLIIDRTVDDENEMPLSSNRNNGMCEAHPGQKLSHFVEETREVICVYCAFNKFKKNPKYEIKEIKEKCGEVLLDVDKILSDNQHYVEILQSTLKDIKDNKTNEEERVSNLYDEVIKYLEEKKSEMYENINNMFANNADKLSEKLDYFSTKMEDAEELKAHIVAVMNNSSYGIHEVLERYTQFIRENSDSNKLNLELIEYKFSHDDENKLIKYLNNFGDLKSKSKYIRFAPKNNNNNPVVVSNLNNLTGLNSNNSILNSNSNLNNLYSGHQKDNNSNLDYQFKNLSINSNPVPQKKNYESNFSANNDRNNNHTLAKYNNIYDRNDVLNTSELVNDDNQYVPRMESYNNKTSSVGTGNFLISSNNNDLMASDPNFRPSSSSKLNEKFLTSIIF